MTIKTKKIDEKTLFIMGLILILVVALVTFLRTVDFSFSKEKEKIASNSPDTANQITYDIISTNDLQKRTLSGKKVILLDIRPFESYAKEHIVDSVNVTVDEFPLDQKYDRSYEIVVISDSIEDPAINTAVKKLEEQNFNNVKVLAGGLNQWKSFAGATVSYGDPNSIVDQAKVGYISAEKIKNRLDDPNLYIVDVRDPADYSRSHIKNAVNFPFNDLEKRRHDILTTKQLVVVGINELQEFEAAVQIHDMLLTSTYAMNGGMPEWEKNNFPLENK